MLKVGKASSHDSSGLASLLGGGDPAIEELMKALLGGGGEVGGKSLKGGKKGGMEEIIMLLKKLLEMLKGGKDGDRRPDGEDPDCHHGSQPKPRPDFDIMPIGGHGNHNHDH